MRAAEEGETIEEILVITKEDNVSHKAQKNDSPTTRASKSQVALEDKEEMKASYFLEDLDLLDNDG